MKKVLLYLGAIIILASFSFAADKFVMPAGTIQLKTNIIKPAKMHAKGKVIEISDNHIIIVRKVKGDTENMEFKLDKPAKNVIVNDNVKINYIERDGNLIALKVIKVIRKKR
ncbi:MAG: hypothetical protein APR62_12945 [Smithella sp. SDB]|nr:MAG: hypothetical protein APR62_12945 [Smithella sp. SDB]